MLLLQQLLHASRLNLLHGVCILLLLLLHGLLRHRLLGLRVLLLKAETLLYTKELSQTTCIRASNALPMWSTALSYVGY
jgi:hypothetical protein